MRAVGVILIALLVSVSCAAAQSTPQTPQTQLPLSKLTIITAHGPVGFTVELAENPTSQERGLMFRQKLAPDAGMLFDFHRPSMVSFWMKNTILPLDMVFIRANGTIAMIHANAVPYSEVSIPSPEPVRAVLEINGGEARALGIEPGDIVRHAIFHNDKRS